MTEKKNDKISSTEIKLYNKRLIFRTLLKADSVTKQELAAQTSLSIPKITQVLAELSDQGLVRTSGIQASSGGRRPEAFCAEVNSRLAAGINITRHHLNFSVLNLKGELVVNERISFYVKMDADFSSRIYSRFMQFLGEHSVSYNKLTGLGIALPGIISLDNDFLAYSHVMQTSEPFDLRPLKNMFKIPVTFFNDANAACMAECYTGQAPASFNFLSLSDTVGGAMVIDQQIVSGSSGRAGEPGHIQIVPGGKPCYCGKTGHYDSYGSSLLLSEAAGGSLADFFSGLAQQNPAYVQIFDEYLYYLALLTSNLRLWTDLPVLIGGYTASYLAPYLHRLKAKIAEMSIFTEEREYLYLSSYCYEASSVGCARYFVEYFIDRL